MKPDYGRRPIPIGSAARRDLCLSAEPSGTEITDIAWLGSFHVALAQMGSGYGLHIATPKP